MRYLNTLIVLLFFAISIDSARAQNIKIVDYKQFRSYLDNHNDTLYILNFWATWCKPCIEEMPAFEKINKVYKGEKVKVVLVSLDFPDQIDTRLKRFIRVKGIQSEVILLDEPDADKWISLVSKNWSGAIPGTLFYRNSKREFYEQTFSYIELNEIVKLFLK